MKRREFVEKFGVGSAAAAFVSSAGLTDASKTPEHAGPMMTVTITITTTTIGRYEARWRARPSVSVSGK